MCRLVTIVEYKAATYPTLDPTFYGMSMGVLALLEVDVAGICASVPVFWPILTAKLDTIFVTREVMIERSDRYSPMDDDDFELSSSYDGKMSGATFNSEETAPGKTGGHYTDEFVASQVDPFSQTFTVETEVTATKTK